MLCKHDTTCFSLFTTNKENDNTLNDYFLVTYYRYVTLGLFFFTLYLCAFVTFFYFCSRKHIIVFITLGIRLYKQQT